MIIQRVKYGVLMFILLINSTCLKAQSGMGAPVLWQHFGLGTADPLLVGTPLSTGKTSFAFSKDVCPPAGSYTIVRRVNLNGCFNNEWISLSSDYNSDLDPAMDYGMMMLVNHGPHDGSQVLFVDTVQQPLCPGTRYTFAAAIINTDRPEPCTGATSFPRFAFNIEDDKGHILFTDTTSEMSFASSFMGYKFGRFSMPFVMPSGVQKLVARINVLSNPAECGEDFAIDDIRISAAGPNVKIAFENADDLVTVRSVCFQQNASVTLTGNIDSFYNNTALQWQQSTDYGQTWIDIAGETSPTFTRSYSVPDTLLFRLSGAEAANIANSNCRVVSNTKKVEINGLPATFKTNSNSPVCAGQRLLFSVEGGASYIWTGPNGYYNNVSYAEIFSTSLKDSGMYYVDIITLGGCKTTDSTYVRIIGTDVDAGTDTAICKGKMVTLHASAGTQYLWTSSEKLVDSTNRSIRVSPLVNTTYSVRVTDRFGCLDSASVTVSLRNAEIVKAVIDGPAFLCPVSDSALFTDKSVGKITQRFWQFGNGQTSTIASPPMQYYSSSSQQQISVQLYVQDTTGCSDSVVHYMKVPDNCYIAVPTGFTPNGDGKNDYLYPLNAYKASHLVFRVYDRWGKLMFATEDWTRKWDGKIAGMEQPAGTYVWMLDYTDAAGKKVSLKGTTVLIR